MKTFKSPLSVDVGKPRITKAGKVKQRKFILNLNQYRNTHYRTSNQAKQNYKEFMAEQIQSLAKHKITKCCIIYTVYKGDKREFDIGNICAIHQKFFEDAMVENNKLKDDNYTIIPMVIQCYGGIDKDNPRVEVQIVEDGLKLKTTLAKMVKTIIERLY